MPPRTEESQQPPETSTFYTTRAAVDHVDELEREQQRVVGKVQHQPFTEGQQQEFISELARTKQPSLEELGRHVESDLPTRSDLELVASMSSDLVRATPNRVISETQHQQNTSMTTSLVLDLVTHHVAPEIDRIDQRRREEEHEVLAAQLCDFVQKLITHRLLQEALFEVSTDEIAVKQPEVEAALEVTPSAQSKAGRARRRKSLIGGASPSASASKLSESNIKSDAKDSNQAFQSAVKPKRAGGSDAKETQSARKVPLGDSSTLLKQYSQLELATTSMQELPSLPKSLTQKKTTPTKHKPKQPSTAQLQAPRGSLADQRSSSSTQARLAHTRQPTNDRGVAQSVASDSVQSAACSQGVTNSTQYKKLLSKSGTQRLTRSKKTEKESTKFHASATTLKDGGSPSGKKKRPRKDLSELKDKLRDEAGEQNQLPALRLFDEVESIESHEEQSQTRELEVEMDLLCEEMLFKVMAKEIRKSIVADAVHSINSRISTKQAMKLVQKRMIKSVTKKMVTEIIQESTDAIYQFEDDSITLADFVLRLVLKQEIRNTFHECKRHMLRRGS